MKSIKIIALLLTLVMILTFVVSCGANEDDTTTTTTTTSSSESAGGDEQPNPDSDVDPNAEKAKVTFLNEDGTELSSSEVVVNEKITLPQAQALKAKKFEGWKPEEIELLLPAGAEYKVVKEMTFTATYSDVYPIDPADYEKNFVVEAGSAETITINTSVLDTTKPITIGFRFAQNGNNPGHLNSILRINGKDTLKVTGGYATFVLDPDSNQYPANGAETGWWGYQGADYPNTKMYCVITIDVPNNYITFAVGRDTNVSNYRANITMDISGDKIVLDFGNVMTPELTINDLYIAYTDEDGNVVNPGDFSN